MYFIQTNVQRLCKPQRTSIRFHWKQRGEGLGGGSSMGNAGVEPPSFTGNGMKQLKSSSRMAGAELGGSPKQGLFIKLGRLGICRAGLGRLLRPRTGVGKHRTPRGAAAPQGARAVPVATAEKRHGRPRMAMTGHRGPGDGPSQTPEDACGRVGTTAPQGARPGPWMRRRATGEAAQSDAGVYRIRVMARPRPARRRGPRRST